ncbi:MAG: CoA transferase, partial [Chloroflexota bacterium]|nr:CoA transferase [Chloroflexota bacterium]
MASRPEPLLPEQFGPLQGVRILSTGTIIAQPFAATLAAEMGAEVVQIERPGVGDILRSLGLPLENPNGPSVGTMWVQDRRNTFFATLD